MFLKKIILFLIFSCGSFCFAAEKITIDDAVKSALENNIDIKLSDNSLKLLKKQKDFSWNSISPTLNASGNFSQNFEGDVNSLSISGGVNLAISSNLYTSIRNANLNYETGKITAEQKRKLIELNVRTAFYGLLYEQENISLQKRGLETSENQYKQNQEKFKKGQMSELDVLTSRVNYEQKKPSVEAAIVAYQNDLALFKQIIGIDQSQELEIVGSLDDVLKIKSIKLSDSDVVPPDVLLAEKSLEIAENSLLASRFSAYIPTISAGFNYGKAKSSANDEWSTTNNLSVGVSIPLDSVLPWSTKSINVAVSKKNVEDAKLNLEKTNTAVSVQIENLVRKINQAIYQIDSLKSNVELAEKTYNMTKTAYNYGKTDLLNLQSASDKVLSASVNLKYQAYSLISTILQLENLLGIPYGTLGLNK